MFSDGSNLLTGLPVFEVGSLQCGECGSHMFWENADPPKKGNTHHRAHCSRCNLTVSVPLRMIECEIIAPIQKLG